jgi:hypothetical protein
VPEAVQRNLMRVRGGAGLYIAGLLAFKLTVWGRLSYVQARSAVDARVRPVRH